jgi:hypothetical protein
MTYQIEFFVLLHVFASLAFISEAFFGELSYLHFVVLGIEDLPFKVLDFNPVGLHLKGQPFDLDGLEHHHKRQIAAQIDLLGAVGQVLNAGSQSL